MMQFIISDKTNVCSEKKTCKSGPFQHSNAALLLSQRFPETLKEK